MSFSFDVKDELTHRPRLKREQLCLLSALTQFAGTLHLGQGLGLVFSSEHPGVTKLIEQLVRALYDACVIRSVREQSGLSRARRFEITLAGPSVEPLLLDTGVLQSGQDGAHFSRRIVPEVISTDRLARLFLRGTFLAAGSLSNPQRRYHLEILVRDESLSDALLGLMNNYDLNARKILRNESFVIYLKESDNILAFLALIGANNAIMEFENVRIVKDIRNNLNRAVNCDSANMDKTLDAALKQIASIRRINECKGLANLPAPLRDMAEARLNNPEASLRELAELLGVGRSGVYHRLARLDAIALSLGADSTKKDI